MKRYREVEKIEEYAERLGDETKQPGFFGRLGARFVVLWALITRIPLPKGWWPQDDAMPHAADALVMMPPVGGILGFISILPAWLLSFAVPSAPCAWIACGIYTIAGWSLHLDGWGDLWDGVGSGKKGEEMRAVMKDSCSGSFGVAGIVLAIGVRASLLSAIDPGQWLAVCVVAGGVGRFAANAAAYVGAYPWEAGLGREFVSGFKGYQLFCAFLAACLLFPFAPFGWIIGTLLASLAGVALARWANRTLGGTNGDILGAAAVLGEILVLAGCAV